MRKQTSFESFFLKIYLKKYIKLFFYSFNILMLKIEIFFNIFKIKKYF
jgi:hypothetical protein